MRKQVSSTQAGIYAGLVVMAAVFACALQGAPLPAGSAQHRWTASQLVSPQALARELSAPKSQRPVVVCVGFQVLYRGAHIPGARYAGPARQWSGIVRLKRWARSVPKRTPVVIYCGCCPWKECPNVRPAYEALRASGFANVRVLHLPNSFAQDWVAKGYPTQRLARP
jgi:thiosulfate/3-mercaptopyruvate sulfurtransferase